MRRATTPTHSFVIDIDPNAIAQVLITYEQHRKVVLEKRKSDLTLSGNTWSFTLTQEEANMFLSGNVSVQVRVTTNGGQALASDIFDLDVHRVLNDEVLV